MPLHVGRVICSVGVSINLGPHEVPMRSIERSGSVCGRPRPPSRKAHVEEDTPILGSVFVIQGCVCFRTASSSLAGSIERPPTPSTPVRS